MDTLLFSVIALAIVWLIAWSVVDRSKLGALWWPFDYRRTDAESSPTGSRSLDKASWRSRREPVRSWNRSGS